MNIKEARKIKPGALVRFSWLPGSKRYAIILDKRHIVGLHRARNLGSMKEERYELLISWLGKPVHAYDPSAGVTKWVQNWEMMVISHAK